jgi:hypothetical protein
MICDLAQLPLAEQVEHRTVKTTVALGQLSDRYLRFLESLPHTQRAVVAETVRRMVCEDFHAYLLSSFELKYVSDRRDEWIDYAQLMDRHSPDRFRFDCT